jgi:hypothetical protein
MAVVTREGDTQLIDDAERSDRYDAIQCRLLGFRDHEPEHATCRDTLLWRRGAMRADASSGSPAWIGAFLTLLVLALLPVFVRR